MKKLITIFALGISCLGSYSFAHQPDQEELRQNWNTCVNSDPSWYNRWGAYVVSFDQNEAYRICRGVYQNSDVDMMGCRVDHKWLKAGYYCDFEH